MNLNPTCVSAELALLLSFHLPQHQRADPLLEPQLCALHLLCRTDHNRSILLQHHHHSCNTAGRRTSRTVVVLPGLHLLGMWCALVMVAVLQIGLQLSTDGWRDIQLHKDLPVDYDTHGVVCSDGARHQQPHPILRR